MDVSILIGCAGFSIVSMGIASGVATRFQNKMSLAEIFIFTAQILCTFLLVALFIGKVEIF